MGLDATEAGCGPYCCSPLAESAEHPPHLPEGINEGKYVPTKHTIHGGMLGSTKRTTHTSENA